jgi:integrase
MPTKLRVVGSTETTEMRPVAPKGRKANVDYRIREHLTEAEVDKLLAALKRNRHGHRDWLIGLLIYRHGLRVSEACDLRWDDIDLGKRTIVVRRLKGSTDSSHYLERDEHKALGDLWRANAAKGVKAGYVFVNERGAPFGRMGIGQGRLLGCHSRCMCICSDIRRAMPWRRAEWIPGGSSITLGMRLSPTRCATPL